ncbi:MAG: 16S rRNA (guanine(966)-N(2))-methyltransferase RsmD [Verrucomicrobiota bacterium]
MRITGGTLGRRDITVPKGIRPTQDKVRAAIFSSLAAEVPGARVLDLFAGSGALGLEAWSRGASFVCWVESDRRVLNTLKENVGGLCTEAGGRTEIRQADALGFLRKGWTGEPFDLILADPPYEQTCLPELLLALEQGGILASGGLLVFEQGASEEPARRPGWVLLKDKTYGDTRVLVYKRA